VCHAVRAPASNVTSELDARAGALAWNRGSTCTDPVKFSAAPCRTACEPLRTILICSLILGSLAVRTYREHAKRNHNRYEDSHGVLSGSQDKEALRVRSSSTQLQEGGLLCVFRSSIPGPPIPLSTLQATSRDVSRKTEGQDGVAVSLLVGSFIPYNMQV
jgi:hypothetical protein